MAVRSSFPDGILSNAELAAEYGDWDAAKIFAKTGIRERHIAAVEECASDFGVHAAEKLFSDGVARPEEIDYLLFCTQSPDYFLPTSACIMHQRLGLREDCGALDYNLGCSGYVYGLSLAKSLIESGQGQRVLLITSDTYSKYIHPKDRSVRTIFGDGGAATLLSNLDSSEEMLGPIHVYTDGRGADKLIVPAGAHRCPITEESYRETADSSGNIRSDRHLYMNGPDIFTFTIDVVPRAVKRMLDASNLSMEDIDLFIFHQANKFMLDYLRKKIGIPEERFCIDMEDVGNTVSASIPIAYERARTTGRIHPGNRILMMGFGVGLSWGAALMRVVS